MHEHLDAFGIINMNGRVYDPLTASFFSPDPFVQAPGNWLNFNRYAYCYGNPFKYTDPSGEWFFIAIALVGGGFNLINNISKIDSFEAGLGYFLSGAGGAVISVFNPAAGGTFTTIGNTIMDVATGNLPDFSKPEQVLGYVGGKVLDGFSAAGIGQMGKQLALANGWLTSIQTTGNFTKLGTSITSEAGIGGLEVVVTSSKTSGGAVGPLLQAQKGVLQTNAKTGVQYTDDLVKAAQQAYPKLAGKVHLHHPIPQYLGGAKNQILVPLDAAYHQQITNAFRIEWGYGLGKPSAAQLETIIRNVYFKFPIP